MPLISSLHSDLISILQTKNGNDIRDPKYTARVIIADICGIDRTSQLAHPDQAITDDIAARARNVATRHASGEPLSRIRGISNFYDLDFELSPDTLDPRPETEIIVRKVLQLILPLKGGGVALEGDGGGDIINIPENNLPHITPTQTISLLDMGTGTGCIPIAILKHALNVYATAIDISDEALYTARRNAVRHNVDNRLTLIRSNWYDMLGKKTFNIITSNPPYIPTRDIADLDSNVRLYDPIRALDGGTTGLDPYEILFAGLDTHLTPGGIALFEIGINQAPDIMRLGEKYGLDVQPPIIDDGQIPRVICVTRPPQK